MKIQVIVQFELQDSVIEEQEIGPAENVKRLVAQAFDSLLAHDMEIDHIMSDHKLWGIECDPVVVSLVPQTFIITTLKEVECTYKVVLEEGGFKDALEAWQSSQELNPATEQALKGQEVIRITGPDGSEIEAEDLEDLDQY